DGSSIQILSAGNERSGQYYMEMHQTAGGGYVHSSEEDDAGNRRYIEVNPGDTVYYGGYINFTSGSAGYAFLNIQTFGPTKSSVGFATEAKVPYTSAGSGYQKVSDTYDVPTDGSVKYVLAYPGLKNASGTDSYARFDDLFVTVQVDGAGIVAGSITTLELDTDVLNFNNGSFTGTLGGSFIAADALATTNLVAGFKQYIQNANPLNAVMDPGFESGADTYFQYQSGASATFTVTNDSTNAHSGNYYMAVVGPAATYSKFGPTDEDANDALAEVNQDDVVYWGAWAYRASGDASLSCPLALYDKDKVLLGYASSDTISTSGSWQKIASTYTVASAGGYPVKYVGPQYQIRNTGTVTTTAWWDDLFLTIQVDGAGIVASSITTDQIASTTIVAGNIATGTITANEIAGTTITANEIATGTITANEIAGNTIVGSNIAGLSISGKTALIDTGTVGGWTLSGSQLYAGGSSGIRLDATNKHILMGAATGPMSGSGVFIGSDGSSGWDMRAGDPSGHYIHWDESASTLSVNGDISASSTSEYAATVRYSWGDMVPMTSSTSWNVSTAILHPAGTGSTEKYAIIPRLPDGVTITGVSARMNLSDHTVYSASVQFLVYGDGGGGSALATLTASADNNSTVSDNSLNETVDLSGNYTYQFEISLNAVSSADGAGLIYVEVSYTRHSLEQLI
ncbi:MAG TPA: hypothetical protein VKA63_02350, partial [Candidatus Krumholzibacteria bacterium]|nr:hypothetical protein [Candidatus Krumholzibacteria bacterium]